MLLERVVDTQVSSARVSGWSTVDLQARLFFIGAPPPAYAGGTDLSMRPAQTGDTAFRSI
jgi:hypothetical protein